MNTAENKTKNVVTKNQILRRSTGKANIRVGTVGDKYAKRLGMK